MPKGGNVTTEDLNRKKIAVFDFDKTIISRDTAFCFINFLLTTRGSRMFLAAAVIPLFLPLFYHRRTRIVSISALLWIGTVGRCDARIQELFEEFTAGYFSDRFKARFYDKALEEIERHRQTGNGILIISGTPEILVKHIVDRFIEGEFTVIGTRWKKCLGGLVYTRYCLGKNKIALAEERGLDTDRWHYGYSDSSSDIPLLSRCKEPNLINPGRKTIRRVNRALGVPCRVLFWS